jgi:alkylation response protein AidB-like acyl-CoA dehydrogenase
VNSGRSAEHEQFAASLHGMLAAADVPGAARQWAAGDRSGGLAVWRKLAGAGVTALAVPERWGGLGASPLDIVIACEELGHHALPGPVAESVAVVPWLIAALGDESLADRWLPGLAAGEVIATLALPPWRPYAADADAAGLVLLAEGDALWLAEPGVEHRSVDPARSLFEAGGRQVLARGPAVAGAIAQAMEVGALACAAQLLGAGRALLAAGVRHAGQRIQFGRPVGAFQAVKHQLADVAIGLEFAGPLLDEAAAALAAGDVSAFPAPALCPPRPRASRPPPLRAHPHTAARDVSAAKVACTDAARRAARTALQVHGAIGYTEEHDLHLWLTKVRALAGAWGSQAEHRARVIASLATAGPPSWT